MMNRLANCHNQFQGSAKRVLCLCSAGLLRSPTIAWVLSNPPYNFNTRAAGVSAEYALIPVDSVLLEWADEIVCADQDHADALGTQPKPVHVLGVPDKFRFKDHALIAAIEDALAKTTIV